MRSLTAAKSVAATKIGDLVAAAAIGLSAGRMKANTNEVAANAIQVLGSQGVPLDLIPTVIETDERSLTKLILTSMTVDSLKAIGAGETTIERAREMVAVNMTEGLLADLELAAACERVIEAAKTIASNGES